MAGINPIANLDVVKWLTNTGITVTRATRLVPSVKKVMSSKFTPKFQFAFFSTARLAVDGKFSSAMLLSFILSEKNASFQIFANRCRGMRAGGRQSFNNETGSLRLL